MLNRFSKIAEDMRGLINDWSAPVLLAVSGGIDSMCMADLFSRLESPVPFAIAHCNFRLRADESDGDEVLVREWAESRGIVCHVRSFDTVGYSRERGVSIEMAARDLRYGWFSELCGEHGYAGVCVAHNANDNAETLILNMLRGSGLKGLSGMSQVSSLGTLKVMRPLLSFTRKQIEGHVFAHGVPYRDDSTNASSDYKRNRIRNEVFPIFEKINPSFIRTLNREMGYFTEAEEIVSDWASSLIPDMLQEGPECQRRISLPALLSHRHWRYLLYRMLGSYGFNSATIASIEDLLSSFRTLSGKRFLSDTHVLVTGRDELVIMENTSFLPLKSDPVVDEAVLTVRTASISHFRGHVIKVECLPWSSDMDLKQPEGTLVFDASGLRFPFVMRRWIKGDWLIPLGMKGKKKVSDLFTDLKYDEFMKEDALMIVDVSTKGMAESGHVAGVAGVRMDDRYKISETTKEIIRITIDHEE